MGKGTRLSHPLSCVTRYCIAASTDPTPQNPFPSVSQSADPQRLVRLRM